MENEDTSKTIIAKNIIEKLKSAFDEKPVSTIVKLSGIVTPIIIYAIWGLYYAYYNSYFDFFNLNVVNTDFFRNNNNLVSVVIMAIMVASTLSLCMILEYNSYINNRLFKYFITSFIIIFLLINFITIGIDYNSDILLWAKTCFNKPYMWLCVFLSFVCFYLLNCIYVARLISPTDKMKYERIKNWIIQFSFTDFPTMLFSTHINELIYKIIGIRLYKKKKRILKKLTIKINNVNKSNSNYKDKHFILNILLLALCMVLIYMSIYVGCSQIGHNSAKSQDNCLIITSDYLENNIELKKHSSDFAVIYEGENYFIISPCKMYDSNGNTIQTFSKETSLKIYIYEQVKIDKTNILTKKYDFSKVEVEKYLEQAKK